MINPMYEIGILVYVSVYNVKVSVIMTIPVSTKIFWYCAKGFLYGDQCPIASPSQCPAIEV